MRDRCAATAMRYRRPHWEAGFAQRQPSHPPRQETCRARFLYPSLPALPSPQAGNVLVSQQPLDGAGHVLCRVAVAKAALLLDPLRSYVPVKVAAPDASKSQVREPVPHQLMDRLQHQCWRRHGPYACGPTARSSPRPLRPAPSSSSILPNRASRPRPPLTELYHTYSSITL